MLLMKADAIRHLIVSRSEALGIKKGELAQRAGISREMLYKFESGKSEIGISNLMSVLSALGLRLEVVPDILPLPKDYRQQKTRKQRAFIARGSHDAVRGLAHGAKIGAAHIPNLGGEW